MDMDTELPVKVI